ncbi:queuine tRNA-ribosyltransferase [Mycobacterium phage Saguaro]|uniref:Queuine tRNA-ribosyltransferase n=1 Tax=Mycobacterium phage Saguaro TaxID=2315616 RepID=A0A386KAB7_9CAUD|nr:queuine tRNA-ribosyltransferase [Mycobacterium phage Saguaro]AYD81997.1 queuine tRNA-ribosyltransferase [Mycobacterium phage Saguaro]
MIPAPRNILVSYHYFKGYDLNRFAGLRVIGDSGAFSAKHQGAEITTAQLAVWAKKWSHRLCWVAALDVIGDAEATRRNWHELVDEHGVPGVPTVHFGAPPETMDYYVARGVDFIGLGGLVGRPGPAQMRWLVSMFRYARDHHPEVRFHGWGVTSKDALKLPFFSVDSSGWGGGYRYGRLQLRDPATAKVHNLDLNGRTTYTPEIARLLSRHYGVTPSEVATSGPHNRLLMVRLSALSASVLEQQFRRIHRRNPVPAPKWGQLDGVVPGPHMHLADSSSKGLEAVAGMPGPHYHLAGTGQCRDLAVAGPHLHLAAQPNHEAKTVAKFAQAPGNAGPHIHLAEGSSEHLETVAKLNRTTAEEASS